MGCCGPGPPPPESDPPRPWGWQWGYGMAFRVLLSHPAWERGYPGAVPPGCAPRPPHRAAGLTIQMRHQGISEDVFAPEHLTLRGTGAQAHPTTGGGWAGHPERRGCLLPPPSCSRAPPVPGSPGLPLTTGLAGRTSCRQCSCDRRRSGRPAALSPRSRC